MEEIPNKTVFFLLVLMSVNSDKPGSRTDAHAKLLWFYRCSFEEIPKKSTGLFIPYIGLLSTATQILKTFLNEMLPASCFSGSQEVVIMVVVTMMRFPPRKCRS